MASLQQAGSWQETLWREWRFGNDQRYIGRLYKLIAGWSVAQTVSDRLERQGRPYATQVEHAIRQACVFRSKATYGWDKHLRHLDRDRRRSVEVDVYLIHLEAHHWPARFVARHRLVDQGGDAVEGVCESWL